MNARATLLALVVVVSLLCALQMLQFLLGARSAEQRHTLTWCVDVNRFHVPHGAPSLPSSVPREPFIVGEVALDVTQHELRWQLINGLHFVPSHMALYGPVNGSAPAPVVLTLPLHTDRHGRLVGLLDVEAALMHRLSTRPVYFYLGVSHNETNAVLLAGMLGFPCAKL